MPVNITGGQDALFNSSSSVQAAKSSQHELNLSQEGSSSTVAVHDLSHHAITFFLQSYGVVYPADLVYQIF